MTPLQLLNQARDWFHQYRGMDHDRREDEIYGRWGAYAHVIKIYAQMLTGATICVLLVTKAISYLIGVPPCSAHLAATNEILNLSSQHVSAQPLCGFFGTLVQRNTLALVGDGLMYSAGFELAYMLFTPGPDEAIEPVILGMAATILIIISDEKTDWFDAVVPAALTLSIGFLFYLKKVFLPKHEAGATNHRRPIIGITVQTETQPHSANPPPSHPPGPVISG
ncbi:hypothetical protein ABC766_05330 [Methylobacterium fujisawaense]|uniref:hypothetical protein n=1 Tax=Methylobacterium fujisawaense TaxID=107400 RepID=UPI0031F486C3